MVAGQILPKQLNTGGGGNVNPSFNPVVLLGNDSGASSAGNTVKGSIKAGNVSQISTPRRPAQYAVPLDEDTCSIRIDPDWYRLHSMSWGMRRVGGDVFRATFIDLDNGITENAEPDYAEVSVVGRSEQYQVWQGVSNREINITFTFHVQGLSDPSNINNAIMNEVVTPVRWLEALKYPILFGGLTFPPPPVILHIGRLIHHRCVLTSCQGEWLPPFTPDTFLPHQASAACTFRVVRKTLSEQTDFRSN